MLTARAAAVAGAGSVSNARTPRRYGVKPVVVVLYRTLEAPLRATIADHLFSFRRHIDADCVYVNVAFRHDIRRLVRCHPDAVLFHTTLLSSRVRHERFRRLMDMLEPLAQIPCTRIALPQDEHVHTEILSEFVNRLRVNRICSVAPESEWAKIYAGVDTSRVAFERVLTGYLEPTTLERIERASRSVTRRDVDIGYRVHGARASLGRHGQLKIALADAFRDASKRADNLRADISTRFEDTFLGDSWYRFLLRCRFVLGIEGGASVLDPDGSVAQRTAAYLAEHPGAAFDEVEAACFPGLDGALDLRALSPRHLEACATRTGQLLVEGDYNGILEPHVHYLPIRRDLGGLSDVLEATRDEGLRRAMAERAYEDVVLSGKYGYDRFADELLASALGGRARSAPKLSRPKLRRFSFRDRASWIVPLVVGLGVTTLHFLARHTPRLVSTRLRALERKFRGK